MRTCNIVASRSRRKVERHSQQVDARKETKPMLVICYLYVQPAIDRILIVFSDRKY